MGDEQKKVGPETTDQEREDQKQAELAAQRDEHNRRTAGESA